MVTSSTCLHHFRTCRVTILFGHSFPFSSSLFGIILLLASPTVCLSNYPGLLQSNPSHNNQPNRRVLEIRRSERFSELAPEETPRRYVASRRASRFLRVMEVAYAQDVAPCKRALPHYQCSTSTPPVWWSAALGRKDLPIGREKKLPSVLASSGLLFWVFASHLVSFSSGWEFLYSDCLDNHIIQLEKTTKTKHQLLHLPIPFLIPLQNQQ